MSTDRVVLAVPRDHRSRTAPDQRHDADLLASTPMPTPTSDPGGEHARPGRRGHRARVVALLPHPGHFLMNEHGDDEFAPNWARVENSNVSGYVGARVSSILKS